MKPAIISAVVLMALPFAAYAVPVAAPEPGILPLLSAGGIVMLALYLLRRRK